MQRIDQQDGLTKRSGEAAHKYLGVFLKRQQGKKQKLDKMAHERASHNLYNSRHLETCIAEALEIGEFQRRNNALGNTTKDLVKQHTNTWEYFLKRQQAKKKLDKIARECASCNLYNSRHLKTCIAEALEISEFQRRNNVLDGNTTVSTESASVNLSSIHEFLLS